MAKLAAAAIGKSSNHVSHAHPSLSNLSSSGSSAAVAAPFLNDSRSAATSAPRSKRSRNGTSLTSFRGDDTFTSALPAQAANNKVNSSLFKKRKYSTGGGASAASSLASSKPSAAPTLSRARPDGARHLQGASSLLSTEPDASDDDGYVDDDNSGVGGGSSAFTTASASFLYSAATASATSAVGGVATSTALVAQAASSAWTTAIAAARTRIVLLKKNPLFKYEQASAMSRAQSDLDAVMKLAAAATNHSALQITAAASRLAEATSTVTSAASSLSHLKRDKVYNNAPRFSLSMTWVSAAEDEALRWVAAAEVAHDPAPSHSDAAIGSIASLVSQSATAALTAAVAAARVRVDYRLNSARGSAYVRSLREAKRGLIALGQSKSINSSSQVQTR